MLKKFCKHHGELSEGDYSITIKKKKYTYVRCLICDREYAKNKSAEDKDKENQRRNELRRAKRGQEKTTKFCKRHGEITPQMQNTDRDCKLCIRESYLKNRDKRLAYSKNKRIENINNPPPYIECHKHGRVEPPNINNAARCSLCQREWHRDYGRRNRHKISERNRLSYKRRYSEISTKRKAERVRIRAEKRSHWKEDTVKECDKHGQLRLDQTLTAKWIRSDGAKMKMYVCKYCRHDSQKVADINRKQDRAHYNRLPEIKARRRPQARKSYYKHREKRLELGRKNSRESVEHLKDSYVRRMLVCQGWDWKSIPKEVIDLKRTVMLIRRKVKHERHQKHR